ncbi:tumor necrosis factor receptor superfamily member 6B [Chaetodon auriga]|uniref:tumor necrosis factor receptor superfamily member 6B n=1 Tax=Chaetodon auriga TaxID=39042 RepID=UPI004032CEC3
MMLVSFLLVLLLSTRAALAEGVAPECDRCPPGTYLRARCTPTEKSDCAPCPAGSFTELWNYIGKCLRCGVCGQNQRVKTACTASSDSQCECQQGYYYKKKYDLCLPHSECPPGQEVLTLGTADEDTVCKVCPNGTFSDTFSPHKNCTEHKSCEAAGLQLLLKGSTWHDSVCVSCQDHSLKDGADYLKEIIPAFFAHQKIHIRRLRRIVHKLPSEDCKRQGKKSGLSLSDLHKRINAWVSSATATQIRQLPAILTKTGADGAGERLQNKLQRIDSRLPELCAFGNEVDVVLRLG